MFFCPNKVMASNIFCPFWQDTVRFYDFLIAWMVSVTRGNRISSSATGGGGGRGEGLGGECPPKNTDNFIRSAYQGNDDDDHN